TRPLHSLPTRRSSDLGPPKPIDQMPWECVAAYITLGQSFFLSAPRQVGTRADGSISRCMISNRGMPFVTLHPFMPRFEIMHLERSEEHTSELQSRENL